MNIKDSIENIYREISLYSGNFGDPIVDLIDFNPIEIFRSNNDVLNPGVGIALLVLHVSNIDNSTFEDAQKHGVAQDIKEVLDQGYCRKFTKLEVAFSKALQSEILMNEALEEVYRIYVQRNT